MKSKKLNKKILDGLKETLSENELSKDKGKINGTKYPKPNRKTRKHSGRKEVYVDDEDYPYQEVFYDIWDRYDDGLSRIKPTQEYKNKVKREKVIRKAKKMSKIND